MRSLTLNAIFIIATSVLSTGAVAQNAYKCGNAYSQIPCPGGVKLDALDSRTSAQKTQADLARRRDARTADAMEQARLQQEKIDRAANTPTVRSVSTAAASTPGTTQSKKKKKKKPEYFTAQAPGEKKKKQAAKKSTGNQTGNKS